MQYPCSLVQDMFSRSNQQWKLGSNAQQLNLKQTTLMHLEMCKLWLRSQIIILKYICHNVTLFLFF